MPIIKLFNTTQSAHDFFTEDDGRYFTPRFDTLQHETDRNKAEGDSGSGPIQNKLSIPSMDHNLRNPNNSLLTYAEVADPGEEVSKIEKALGAVIKDIIEPVQDKKAEDVDLIVNKAQVTDPKLIQKIIDLAEFKEDTTDDQLKDLITDNYTLFLTGVVEDHYNKSMNEMVDLGVVEAHIVTICSENGFRTRKAKGISQVVYYNGIEDLAFANTMGAPRSEIGINLLKEANYYTIQVYSTDEAYLGQKRIASLLDINSAVDYIIEDEFNGWRPLDFEAGLDSLVADRVITAMNGYGFYHIPVVMIEENEETIINYIIEESDETQALTKVRNAIQLEYSQPDGMWSGDSYVTNEYTMTIDTMGMSGPFDTNKEAEDAIHEKGTVRFSLMKGAPASAILDENVWEEAKDAVGPDDGSYDDYYAVVMTVYKNMGGKTKGD